MDKNTIIGLVLIFGLVMGYSFYNSSKIKQEKEKELVDNLEKQIQEQIESQTTATMPDSLATADNAAATTTTNTQPAIQHKPFSTLEIDVPTNYVVETDMAKYHISSKGGYISQIELKNTYRYSSDDSSAKAPLILFEGNTSTMGMDLMLKDQTVINSADYYFMSESADSFVVSGDEKQTISFKMYPTKQAENTTDSVSQIIDKESYIEYLYTFSANDFKFGMKINFVNMASYLYPNRSSFTLNWNADLINLEKNYDYEKTLTTLFYMDNLNEVNNLDKVKDDKKSFTSPLKWVAFRQQFFTSVMIAESANFNSGELVVKNYDNSEVLRLKEMNANLDFELNNLNNSDFDLSFYFGPNQFKLLKKYDLNMENMVPIGDFFLLKWLNRFAIIPIFNWLENYGLNYGIIILILTILLKTFLLPIAYKTYLSSARMRLLKPEIEDISKRYPKQEDMAKKQQATMALYKMAGVSPTAGCLPMLLQMPILIAMFRFFPSAYELRQQSFLWATDLSTYDSILDLGFKIPFYGDHVSLFTLLMTVSTLIYTWINNKMMAPAGGNDQSQKMMKVMMYIMPIMFLGMFNSFSSALTYYYLLVNLISFFQMWIFRMVVNEENLREKIKLNMQKPVKKSKWQLKMEEMAKQQAQMQKNRK